MCLDWIKKFVDIEAHLPDPSNVKPHWSINYVNDYSPFTIPPEYMTPTFLFDLGATWVIYGMAFHKNKNLFADQFDFYLICKYIINPFRSAILKKTISKFRYKWSKRFLIPYF